MSRLRNWTTGAVLGLLIYLSVACAGEPETALPPPSLTPFPPDLYIGLSDGAAPLADLIGAEYENATGLAAPIFLAGNDEALRSDLQQGLLEAVIVYQLPEDSQFWFTPIALDGVVIKIHSDLPVDDLNSRQLQGIFSGSHTNWAEVGGPELAISLFNREPGSGSLDFVQQRIMGDARFSGLARIAATDEFMQQAIETTPGAIGYTMLGSLRGSAIRLDGIEATRAAVTDQSYPLTTPIYFATKDEPSGPLRDFLAWIQSPDGQAVLGGNYGRVR